MGDEWQVALLPLSCPKEGDLGSRRQQLLFLGGKELLSCPETAQPRGSITGGCSWVVWGAGGILGVQPDLVNLGKGCCGSLLNVESNFEGVCCLVATLSLAKPCPCSVCQVMPRKKQQLHCPVMG